MKTVGSRTDVFCLACGLLVLHGCGLSRSSSDARETGGAANAGIGAGGRRGQAGSRSADSGGTRAGGGAHPDTGGAPSTGGSGGVSGVGGTVTAGRGNAQAGNAALGGRTINDDGGATAAGAAQAGNAGEGGDPDACAVTVPASSSAGSLQAAIDAAPVPSTVCIEGGRFAEDLQLRGGVSVRGTGIASVVCGAIIGDAATSATTTLSDLQIAGRLSATGSVKLALRHLQINTGETQVCAPGSDPVRIVQNGSGALELAVEDVTIGSPGFDIAVKPGGERIDDSIVIQSSRCDSSSQCYDFLRFTFDTQPAAQAAAGSRLVLDVFNNVVRSIVLEGIVFDISGGLYDADMAASRLWFRHNTLASDGDLNSAISFSPQPTLPIVLANNTVAYVTTPVLGGDVPDVTQVGNVLSDDASSKSWFSDFAGGNFAPSDTSPLIGSGANDYGVATDIDGKPRVGGFDSGAYQH